MCRTKLLNTDNNATDECQSLADGTLAMKEEEFNGDAPSAASQADADEADEAS